MTNKTTTLFLMAIVMFFTECSKSGDNTNSPGTTPGTTPGNTKQPYIVDNTFVNSASGELTAGGVQADNKVVAGGSTGLIRFNVDGSTDQSFKTPVFTGSNGSGSPSFRSIAVQTDGKILVGGSFKTGSYTNIIRLNTDGTIDASFSISGLLITNTIETVKLQMDGKILIAGGLSYTIGTKLSAGAARLSNTGTLDASFSTGNLGRGSGLTILSTGKILLFTTQAGVLIKLNADGTTDPAFKFTTKTWSTNVAGIPGFLYTITISKDGKIYIGGDFMRKGDELTGTGANGILQLNDAGAEVTTFKSPEKGSGPINTILPLDNGKLMIGRTTPLNYPETKDYITLLNADGTAGNFELAEFVSGEANVLLSTSDNKIFMLGSFVKAPGSYRIIVRLKPQ